MYIGVGCGTTTPATKSVDEVAPYAHGGALATSTATACVPSPVGIRPQPQHVVFTRNAALVPSLARLAFAPTAATAVALVFGVAIVAVARGRLLPVLKLIEA
eukprot:354204-Chlamydomonas_euryale.AAC.4